MPTLSITNATSSRLPVNQFIGTLGANELKNIDLTANQLEMSKDQLVELAAAGLITWDVSSTVDTADNAAEPVMGGSILLSGAGDPTGAVTADIGTAYLRSDGGAGTTLYIKEAGGGLNTGWVAK